MFKAPSELTLWDYQSDVMVNINKYWWRLWLLKLLSKHDYIVELLEQTWVIVQHLFIPTIISNWQTLSAGEYEKIIYQYNIFSKIHNWMGWKLVDYKNWEIASILGIPWDFWGVIDVLSTSTTTDLSKNGINLLIKKVIEEIQKISNFTYKNIQWTEIKLSEVDLSVWVMPKINVKKVIATEFVDGSDLFIDKINFNIDNQPSLNWFNVCSYTETSDISYDTSNNYREKIGKFLDKLRELKILDKDIIYHLEFWELFTWELFLLNIKEVSRKNSQAEIMLDSALTINRIISNN